MRVTKNEYGDFIVEDEPIQLEGHAADEFVREMSEREEEGDDTARRVFLEECDRAYASSLAKKV